MGEKITREKLFNYFTSSYFLEGYESIKAQFTVNNEFDDKKIEEKIDFYRRHKNFELLVPLLIMTAQFQIEKQDYQLATIYLIECYSLLRKLDRNNDLLLYVILELAQVLEDQQHYNESGFYYMKAIQLSVEKQAELFINYCLKKLGELTILSNTQKHVNRFKPWIKEFTPERIATSIEYFLDIEKLYVQKEYVEVIKIIDELQDTKVFEDTPEIKFILDVRHRLSLFKLGKETELTWINQDVYQEFENITYQPYKIEYELVYYKTQSLEKYIEYIQNTETKLKLDKKWYLLDLLYENLLDDPYIKRDKMEHQRYLVKSTNNKEFINLRENKIKDRLQNIHTNYKEYYSTVESEDINNKLEVLDKVEFEKSYEKNYSKLMTVINISFDEYFYKEMPENIYQHITTVLSLLIGRNISFQKTNNHMVWLYFKTHESSLKLKQRLARSAEVLSKVIDEKFTFNVCLPKNCEAEFDQTKEKIIATYYCSVLESTGKEPYIFSCYQKGLKEYEVSKKLYQLLESARKTNKLSIQPTYFYDIDSHKIEGIEFVSKIDEYMKFTDIIESNQNWIKDILITEIELFVLKMACEYMNKNFKQVPMPSIFVKLSRVSLLNKFLVMRVRNCLEEMKIDPSQIVIEINESTIFESNEELMATINYLQVHGCHIALDDYGTGTLTGSIRNVSINYLKLSEQMLKDLNDHYSQQNVMETIQRICLERNIQICCQNIHSESAHHMVSDFGIKLASGAYYQ